MQSTTFNLVFSIFEFFYKKCYNSNKEQKEGEWCMIRRELLKVLNLLNVDEYRTAAQLADALGLSEKTIRLRIKDLNEELVVYGAKVSAKARFGYRMEITDQKKFDLLEIEEETNQDYIPDTGEERSEYLLKYLIWHHGYVKAEELCDTLYISRTTLTKTLREVERILKRYGLTIDRKPNYGMKLQGKELDIRRLICDYFIKREYKEENVEDEIEEQIVHFARNVRNMMLKYEIPISETAFENFIEYVYIACQRMKNEFCLEIPLDEAPEIGIREKSFIKELSAYIEKKSKCKVTKEEESYLLLYLSGKRMVGNIVENDTNFVIKERLDRIALEMLEYIYKEYHIDFRNDFDIRMTLNQHLVPLDIRIRFDIPLHNPLLDQIKTNYGLSYQMSREVAQIIEEHYQKKITEDEIGYLALIFELAIEKKKGDERSDILVVCSTGKGSSRLLKYKYEQEFADYLDHIYVCDLIGLEMFDFSKVDYVFTTVPITKEIPVPIVEVGMFLGQEDVQKVTGILKKGPQNYLEQYYKPERFYSHLKFETKDEVLEFLCNEIEKKEKVDDDFYEMVLERESFIQTNYGNKIAMPHPNRIASENTFVYVAVLDHEINWNKQRIQVILLSSIGKKEDPNRQKFYEATANFALNGALIERLIRYPEYENFIQIMKSE